MMPRKELQAQWDKRFPHGVNVTVVDSLEGPEDPDAVQFISARVMVTFTRADGTYNIQFRPLLDRDGKLFAVHVEKVEEYGEGQWLVHTHGQQFLMTDVVPAELGPQIQEEFANAPHLYDESRYEHV